MGQVALWPSWRFIAESTAKRNISYRCNLNGRWRRALADRHAAQPVLDVTDRLVVPGPDVTGQLLVRAEHARSSLALETTWERSLHAIRDHAIFSGNLGHDATHDLEFGGTGKSADVVSGKVYAAGSVTVKGGAKVNGDVTATGLVSGVVNGDVVQNAPRTEPPDLAAMNYHEIADFRIDAAESVMT